MFHINVDTYDASFNSKVACLDLAPPICLGNKHCLPLSAGRPKSLCSVVLALVRISWMTPHGHGGESSAAGSHVAGHATIVEVLRVDSIVFA